MLIDQFDIVFGIFTIIFIVNLHRNNKLTKVINSIKQYWHVCVVIIFFNIFGNNYINEAIKKATLAFIIAIFASHDLIAAPFYMILVLSYYGMGT